MKTGQRLFVLSFLLGAAITPAAANDFVGARTIKLVEQNGTAHDVGEVTFEPDGDGATYTIQWRDEAFGEHFLSMRPFKCFESPSKHWCRLPYPYENRRRVSASDLTDLEYDLMFVWKGAGEYGINLWNGVYYKLAAEGGDLVGSLHEIDMNVLSSPPEDGNLRPVRAQDLEPGEADSHWLPRLVIE